MLGRAARGEVESSGYIRGVFFFLSKLLDVFLSPYTLGLVLIAAAVPWRASAQSSWKRRRASGAAGLALLLLASTEAVSNALLYRLERAEPDTYDPKVTYDAVVLLGGVVDERVTSLTGQPAYNDNVERLIVTHALLRDGKARVAILSGAAMDPRLTAFGDARVLARQLEDWGISRDRILVEDRARNTRENAVFSQAIARDKGYRRVLVVTSAFHMKRSRECFRAVGMDVDTLAADYRAFDAREASPSWLPRAVFLAWTTATVREIAGRYIYRLQGYGKAA